MPPMVVALLGASVLVHVVRSVFFDFEQDLTFLATFAFIPARFSMEGGFGYYPGGMPAALASTLTYALIHADWTHLIVNGIWLAAFGSAVERRFGAARFLGFSALCAMVAAGAHYAVYPLEPVPVVGASGMISGHMAAALRFVFQPGRAPAVLRGGDPNRFRAPALPIRRIFTDRRVVVFVLVFFGINLAIAAIGGPLQGEESRVAWQAHMGGFLAGMLLFPLFDPVGGDPGEPLPGERHGSPEMPDPSRPRGRDR